MTTGSTNTVFDDTSDAAFRTWGNELMTMLITTLGLTQTADAGQLAFPMTATTRPSINTAAGYYILRFNDTLQATQPIFIKVELGSGGSTSTPALWITVGTGSSAGTISGASARVSCGTTAAPQSTVTNYTSRACYNATQGVLWIDWKQGSCTNNESGFSFIICRSVDNTGAPNANAIGFQGASAIANTIQASSGLPWQWYNAATTAWLGPAVSGGQLWTNWGVLAFAGANAANSTLVGTAGQVYPCFQFAPTASVPGIGVSNVYALCQLSEISLGSTVTLTILGSTSLTYICGQGASSAPFVGGAATVIGMLRIWQ